MVVIMRNISPSILSADFSILSEEIRAVELAGADYIHIDVMDGIFVPNISVGPFIVEAVRKITDLKLDVHLMIEKPSRYIDEFIASGSDIVTVHTEATTHLHRTIQYIKEKGIRAGVALNPSTHLSAIEYILDDIDMVLIMTVNPGFSGQKFIENMLCKIESLRDMADKRGIDLEIEVDGGVNLENISKIAAAGANTFVAGSGIFGTQDYKETIRIMHERIR